MAKKNKVGTMEGTTRYKVIRGRNEAIGKE
jgi:hypothetical protein